MASLAVQACRRRSGVLYVAISSGVRNFSFTRSSVGRHVSISMPMRCVGCVAMAMCVAQWEMDMCIGLLCKYGLPSE